MSVANCRPPGASWLCPYVMVRNVEEAVSFYERAFGFEQIQQVSGDDGSSWHAELRYHDNLILLGKAGTEEPNALPPCESHTPSPINLYLYCEDVDDFYIKAIRAGAKSLGEPEDTFWHDRMCRLEDPNGYLWCFATYLGED